MTEEDYTHNIDDQLLRAVKQEVNVTNGGMNHQSGHRNDNHNHNHHHQNYNINSMDNQVQIPNHYQYTTPANSGQVGIGQQYDENEYNIQIPDPIINSKSKIYPVEENTITAEGNLITKPYPEQTFNNRKDLNDFISEFARDNMFGVVIAHSNKKAIYYTCELGGKYRDKKHKRKLKDEGSSNDIDVSGKEDFLMDPNTKTKKLKCPFAMTASYKKPTQQWVLKTTCNEHNHPQLDPLSNHPMLRKRSTELNLLIVELYKVGTKPSHIESKIKEQYPDILIKREDIYNEIRGYKRKLKREHVYLANVNDVDDVGYRKRTNANNFHHVLDDDEEEGIYNRGNDVDLNFQQATAAVQHHQSLPHQTMSSQVSHSTQLPQQQQPLRQLPMQVPQLNENINSLNSLQPMNQLNMAQMQNQGMEYNDDLSNDQMGIDNIDTRLVGE